MVIERIGFFEYNTEDIVGKCSKCSGNLYNSPILAREIEMSEIQRQMFDIGLWGIGFCPNCYEVEIWYLKT